MSFNCSATKSIEFTLPPAFVISPLTGDLVVNTNALTVGKALSWVMPSAVGAELQEVGLQTLLNSFALTELTLKFQGSVRQVAFRMRIQQTTPWRILDGRLTISGAELDLRRQVFPDNSTLVSGEVYARGTFLSTAVTRSSCASGSSDVACPVDVVIFLASLEAVCLPSPTAS